MARPLLVPVALLTLVGLAPAALAAPPAPAPRANAAPAAAPAAPTVTAPTACDTCAAEAVVATSRSGNARAPSYDDGMIYTKLGPRPASEVVTAPSPAAPSEAR